MKASFFVLLLVSDAVFQQLVLQNILMEKQCPVCRFSQSQIQGRDQNAATEYCWQNEVFLDAILFIHICNVSGLIQKTFVTEGFQHFPQEFQC